MLIDLMFKVYERINIRVKVNERVREKIRKAFLSLNKEVDVDRWIGSSFAVSLFISLLVFLLYKELAFSLASFAFIFLYFVFLPFIEKEKRERKIEGELPLFLKNFGTLINIGFPFLESLKISSRDFPSIREEVDIIARESEKGRSLSKSLKDMYDKFGSINIRRAVAQMINSYESGSDGRDLKYLGGEMINNQRHKIKEYSSKLGLISLVFIMVSVVGPTFLILLSVINPLVFGELSFDYRIALLVLFPSLSILLFILSKSLLPETAFKEEKEDFSVIAIAYVLSLVVVLDASLYVKAFVIFILLLFIGKKSLPKILEERKKERVEKEISNALLIMSSLPEGASIEEIFNRIGKANLGIISEEFNKAKNQIKGNVREDIVFDDLKKGLKTPLIGKVVDVLKYSLEVGVEVNKKMGEMAEDILNYLEIRKEMNSSLSMQKYSLMFGIAIMAVVSSNSLNVIKNIENIGEDIVNVIVAYFLINSAIVGWFSSSLEKKNSNSYVYFVILSIISIFIFYYFYT